MKVRNFIKVALAMIVTAGTFSSCLKDSATTVDFTNAKGSLELPAAAFSGILQPQALDIQSTPTPISLMVNLSGAKPSGSNTTATLAVDQNALTAYNSANNTSFELLPQAAYSISSLSVSIPAGQRSANLTININTSVIDPAKKYVLPLTIVDGGGQQINPQYKTVLFNVQVKNQYDGNYSATGSIAFPPPTAGRTWTNRAKTLSTVDGSTVMTEAADLKGNSFYMYLKVNADNTVTVTPAPTSANQTIQGNGVNKYDPATKTFTLNYKYVGGTGDRVISETITRSSN